MTVVRLLPDSSRFPLPPLLALLTLLFWPAALSGRDEGAVVLADSLEALVSRWELPGLLLDIDFL
jgi:hypothetical protein